MILKNLKFCWIYIWK